MIIEVHSLNVKIPAGAPNMPRDVTSNLIYDDSTGGCVIQLGWSPPINLAQEDISHYIVYVNGINVLNKISETGQNLTQILYPVCNCGAHSVSVSAVSRYDCEGQRSPSIILEAMLSTSNENGKISMYAIAVYISACVCMCR